MKSFNNILEIEPSYNFQTNNIKKEDILFFDIETTGFDPINNKITEISAVKYRSNRKSCIAIFSRGWYKFI